MSTYKVLMTADEIEANEGSWLNERSTGFRIGASESAAILGLSPWSSPLDVWESKQPGAEPIPETRHMTWGKRLEAAVADGAQVDFRDRLGTVLPSPGLLVSNDIEWLASTPDRENTFAKLGPSDDLTDAPVTAVTEIKTGSAFTRSNWWDENGAEIIPPYYEVQLQQQMLVRGVRRGFVAALLGGNELILREVAFSASFAELLVDELDEWRTRYLLGDERPPATVMDIDRFAGKPKGAPDASIIATNRILDLVQQRNVIQPAKSALDKADSAVKDQIRAFMGDQTELVDAKGNLLVTWYAGAGKSAFDLNAFRAAHPAIYEEFLIEKPGNRTMLFKSKDIGDLSPISTAITTVDGEPVE